MPTGAPLTVREFASAAEMKAHYAAVRARCFAPAPRVAPPPAPEPVSYVAPEPEPVVEPEAPKVDPFVERTLAEFGVPTVVTRQQRDGCAEISGAAALRMVAMTAEIAQREIVGDRQIFILVKARQIAMWLLVRRAGKSLPETGRILGGRDHTTVLHGVRRVDATMAALDMNPSASSADLVASLWSAKWPREQSLPHSKNRVRPCA